MSGEGTLNDLYLEWLYGNYIGVVGNKNPNTSYWLLALQLYRTEFYWSIRSDENRSEDGKELRRLFIESAGVEDIEINWLQEPCSVLEMLIGLSCRAAFETGSEPGDWLWRLFRSIGLDRHNDRFYGISVRREVDAIIRRVLDRAYEKNGTGGLFPLRHAQRDQRNVELFYQLQAYLIEEDSVFEATH